MKRRRLLSMREPFVYRTLEQRLPRQYRICPKVRLKDVIGRERKEWLCDEAFGFLLKSHLDFVVMDAASAEPVFAVEFDGAQHDGPPQAGADVIKNTLCRRAELPLLRIRGAELQPHERVTLLDYMLRRYVAWERWAPEGWMTDDDPSFWFDVTHPFPATAYVRRRLAQRHKIAEWQGGPAPAGAHLVCSYDGGQSGPFLRADYWTSERCFAVKPASEPRGAPLFRVNGRASVRTWVPVILDESRFPLPGFSTLADFIRSGADAEALQRSHFECWFSAPPGIDPFGIADHLADYLALRAVEEWANRMRAA